MGVPPADAPGWHNLGQPTRGRRPHRPPQVAIWSASDAAGGGAERRSVKIASAGMNQSREAHLAERSLHSPEGGQSAAVFAPTGSPRGYSQGKRVARAVKGYAGGRVGTRVGTSVGTSVAVDGLGHGGSRAGTGRAAELASEAARAEGASSPSHRPWPAAGRGPGQARSRQAAELAGCPIALDSGASLPTCAAGPRAIHSASIAGGSPGSSAQAAVQRLARRPVPGR
jgi:hypothetical protein